MTNISIATNNPETVHDMVTKTWNADIDPLIPAMWRLIKDSISFVQPEHSRFEIDKEACCQIFGNDPISIPLMDAIIKLGGTNRKFKVSQWFTTEERGTKKIQQISDLTYYKESWRYSQLVLAPASNFAVVIGEAQQGWTIAVWDLRITRMF